MGKKVQDAHKLEGYRFETAVPEKEVLIEENVMDTDHDEEGSATRKFKKGYRRIVVTVIGIAMSLFHIYALCIKPMDPLLFFVAHWGFGFILVFMLYPPKKNSKVMDRVPWYDLLCIAATLIVVVYIWTRSEAFQYRIMLVKPTTMDLILGVVTVLLTLEAARRTTGNGLSIVSAVFLLYALFGNYLPSFIATKGFSFNRLTSYLFSINGIFGTALNMSATNVFLLVLFSAFLHISGAGEFFIDFAMALCGASRGGPAKVATVSSAMFGSISGSAVANVAGTGVLTIPLMKRVGYRPEFAGAVEAVASTGGQIMPPIMGSGAFIMAELLGIPYSTIAIAAIIPALLYYYSVFIAIDLEAVKSGLTGVPKDEVDSPWKVLKERGFLLLPILVLIYFMAIRKFSVSRSAIFAIITCVVASWFSKDRKMGIRQILEALELGAVRSLNIITATACADIAIGVVILTGIGLKITFIISSIAGASKLLSLILAAVATTILGMGLPTVAAYLVSASVLGSALISLGIEPLCAHMFLFYFSILSMITPPVALAAYTAANIADANMNKVGFTAMKLGAIAFMLPFFFVYGPSLLLIGSAMEIIQTAITAFIGINCFTVSLYGWFAGEYMRWPLRILLFMSGVCMLIPGTLTDVIGIACALVALVLYKPVRDKCLGILKKA